MATQDIFSGDEAAARLKQLPPDIQNLIYSADMTRIIQKIGAAHHLHIDEIGKLEAETSFLMLGFTEQKDFPRVLSERIPTDIETATTIATEVHDQLLVKIRESLHRMYPSAIDPVTGERPVPIQLHEKPAIHNVVAVPQRPTPVQPPVASPTVSTGSTGFGTIDAALHTTQINNSKPKEPTTPPKQQPAQYGSDPYLEPIE